MRVLIITGTSAHFMLSEFCCYQWLPKGPPLGCATDPEEHPDADAGVAEGVPRRIAHSTAFDLAILAPELSDPQQLEDLLRGEETCNGKRLRRERSWVLVVQVLHVRLGRHAIDLTRKVEAIPASAS